MKRTKQRLSDRIRDLVREAIAERGLSLYAIEKATAKTFKLRRCVLSRFLNGVNGQPPEPVSLDMLDRMAEYFEIEIPEANE